MPGSEGDWTAELVEINRRGRPPSKVVLAHLHPGEVSTSWQQSVTNATLHDVSNHRRLISDDGRYGMISTQQGAGRLERGRNEACAYFLDNHPQADLLVMIDSDMGFDTEAVETLATVMDETGLPIVGGLCFGVKPVRLGPQQSMDMEWFPTIYRWSDGPPCGFNAAYEYPPDQLVECAGTGAAFLGMSRRCLQKLRDAEGDTWFDPVTVAYDGGERTFGEDMSFCLRARRNGLPVHVHTGIRTSHHKDVWVTEDLYRDQRRPASSAVSVVIPVKDNLAMTRALVGQLIEQGGWHDLLIFDNGSETPEMRQWLENLDVADVYDAAGLGIHEMWNHGINEAVSRHGAADVIILNNDLKLGPRFCQRLVGGMRDTTAMAVCGNYDGRPLHHVQPTRGICAGRYDGTGGLAGFAFALRAEWVADQVTKADPFTEISGYRFPTDLHWWYGDNDLCLSIEKAGGWYGIVGNAAVNHIGGGSQTEPPADFHELIAADRETFLQRWPEVTLAEPAHPSRAA